MEVAVPAHCSTVALVKGKELAPSVARFFCGDDDDGTQNQTFS